MNSPDSAQNTPTIAQAFNEEILHATNAELRRQRDALRSQVDELTALVRSFPGQLTAARLDGAQGKPTVYDYDRAAKACENRV